MASYSTSQKRMSTFKESMVCRSTISLFISFALFASSAEKPTILKTVNLSALGVSNQAKEAALNVITAPIDQVRVLAKRLRRVVGQTAYKASALRSKPCIAFGAKNERIYAPMKELVVLRATAGVYYDLVDAGGYIRHKIGINFEAYCLQLLSAMLTDVQIRPEFSYRKDQQKSPDIMIDRDHETLAAVECKATKLTLEAQFGTGVIPETRSGYDELVKGIFQIWKFFSHARRRLLERDVNVSADAVGIVLTLDDWLEMASEPRAELLRRAEIFAAEEDKEILEEANRRRVTICSIRDMEYLLRVSPDVSSVLATIRRASDDERLGWSLTGLHNDLAEHKCENPYPFKGEEIAKVLPWWGRVPDLAEGQRAAQ